VYGGRHGGQLTSGGRAEDDKNVERVEVRLDGGEWSITEGTTRWALDINTRMLEYGFHIIEARAFDGFTYSTVVSRSFYADQRPVLSITSPSEGEVIHGSTTAEGLSSDDGGAPYVEVRLDGGPWTIIAQANGWDLTLDPALLGSGPHLLEARAFDNYFHSPVAAVNFIIDLPPSIQITSPLGGSHVPVPVNILGRARDDMAVESVLVRINGGEWTTAEGTEEWFLALDLGSGEHVVEARSYDSMTFSGIARLTFQVDIRPTVEISVPASGDIIGRTVEGIDGRGPHRRWGMDTGRVF